MKEEKLHIEPDEKRTIDSATIELANLNSIFVEQSAFAHAMVDLDMRYVSVSKKWYSDFNLKQNNIIGISHYDLFPEIGEEWKAIHRRCLQGEIISCDEDRFVRADGSVQWLRWDVRPWYHNNGSIGGMLMFSEDLTEIKNREIQRNKIQYILNKSAQIAKIATWEMDIPQQQVIVDDMAYEILELEKGTVFSFETPFEMCKDDENRKRLREAAEQITEHNSTYDVQIEIITGKGNVKWIRVIGEADFVNGVNTHRYGIFQDITGMKQAELRLAQLNQDLSAVLNSGQVSIISTDLKGHVRYLNYGAEKMLGYSNAGFILQKDILQLHDANELDERRAIYENKFKCVLTDFGVITIHAIKGEYEASEWLYKTGAGQLFPVQLTVTPVRNDLGKITGYLFVAVDISKMKEVKGKLRSLLEITLQQNKRLKNFAHIVSHNLRSHSVNMEMLIDLLLQEHSDLQNDQGAMYLQKASKNLKETIIHLNEVVAINADENNSLMPVKLRAAIEHNVQSLIQEIQEADIMVINKVPKELEVHGLPAYVDSITLNLLTNAIKYRNRKVKSFVKFEAAQQGDYVVLTVEDNGLGIDLNLHGRKIFKMYKTFHGNKDSRGIGLFITKNQIEAMGGTIEVSSEVNRGTIFTVRLRNEKH